MRIRDKFTTKAPDMASFDVKAYIENESGGIRAATEAHRVSNSIAHFESKSYRIKRATEESHRFELVQKHLTHHVCSLCPRTGIHLANGKHFCSKHREEAIIENKKYNAKRYGAA